MALGKFGKSAIPAWSVSKGNLQDKRPKSNQDGPQQFVERTLPPGATMKMQAFTPDGKPTVKEVYIGGETIIGLK
jgi:hypothetical protein